MSGRRGRSHVQESQLLALAMEKGKLTGVAFVNSFEHVRGFILYPFP